jgi:hypothetical protein
VRPAVERHASPHHQRGLAASEATEMQRFKREIAKKDWQ